ncbi:phosphonate C-P lyase system protein PhnH [Notoacmeibacter sp. MSK16QG-6]|uniref:phosphonate C-P lyase system protein PhnH n=1 Tax=Notoacmeibacter sp. MSK16QG-6 TaxID=2957982 RepID=UPI00209F81ED|nr:phosphonate C-P lyase system protein PhnH [Notoacmeibacter sp. MSK16QG-6]MCP1201121.1 phosphonate C-P lyase system protein PhnH [Notoacmeibacter sp. MSK16QG-6]
MSLSNVGSEQGSPLSGGFVDAVPEAQRAFHALMNALAQPGRCQPLKSLLAPEPLPGLLGTIGCTLLDHQTSVFLDEALQGGGQVGEWLIFQTGTVIADQRKDAGFAFIVDGERMRLADYGPGDQAYPDRSATLCVNVPSFAEGPRLSLEGPGIKGKMIIAPAGLPADFIDQWADNHALFPRGVDLFLTCEGEGVMGLPRSINIVQEG